MDIEEGAESEAIIPGAGEVADFNFFIARGFSLAPQQQTFFRC